MKRHKARLFFAGLALLLVPTILSLALALDVPPLPGRVNDLAGILSRDKAQQLEERLRQFEQETGHQIAVLTIPSLEGDSLEDFSIRVAQNWKIGQKGFDNGVILLFVQKERKIRIEVGYGLEGILPDAVASRIIREEIAPRFRTGDYAGALDAGTEAIIKVARGEAMTHSTAAAPRKGARGPIMDPSLFIFAAFIAVIVGITRRTPVGGAVGGAISGGAVGTLASSSGLWIFYLLIGAIIGFLANFYVERAWGKPWSARSSRRDRWPRDTISYGDGGGGDFGGGGFGGDFGSGGFSGGGGDFGGGGASGDG
jgi:uncharacterized protein